MLAHLAGHVGNDVVPIAQFDHETGVRKDFIDDSFHFDHFLFGQGVPFPWACVSPVHEWPGQVPDPERI